MNYKCEATTLGGFIQQVALCYLRSGYIFFVRGEVPEDKDPRAVDAKLMRRYGVGISEKARILRKRRGQANVQYIRFGRDFLLMATHGEHELRSREAAVLKDARHDPIRIGGYSLGVRQGRVHVRIEQEEYLRERAWLLELAQREVDSRVVEDAFLAVPYDRYAPVKMQLECVFRKANELRKRAGRRPLSARALEKGRRMVKPFEAVAVDLDEAA